MKAIPKSLWSMGLPVDQCDIHGWYTLLRCIIWNHWSPQKQHSQASLFQLHASTDSPHPVSQSGNIFQQDAKYSEK